MFTDSITLSKESIKKYGATGSIVLQVLYSHYGETIPYDLDVWKDLFKGSLTLSQVKGSLTKMSNEKKLDIDDDVIYLGERKQVSIHDLVDVNETKVDVKPKKKKGNPNYPMAVSLTKVLGFSQIFVDPTRYLNPAGKLMKQGYTPEYIENRYGKNGWWYTANSPDNYKGQQGGTPNLSDIYKTVDDKKYVNVQNKVDDDKSSNFFR